MISLLTNLHLVLLLSKSVFIVLHRSAHRLQNFRVIIVLMQFLKRETILSLLFFCFSVRKWTHCLFFINRSGIEFIIGCRHSRILVNWCVIGRVWKIGSWNHSWRLLANRSASLLVGLKLLGVDSRYTNIKWSNRLLICLLIPSLSILIVMLLLNQCLILVTLGLKIYVFKLKRCYTLLKPVNVLLTMHLLKLHCV